MNDLAVDFGLGERAAPAVTFLDDLFAAGLLVPSGVAGLYGRAKAFEDVVDAVRAMVGRAGAVDGAEEFSFPPAMARQTFEESGYLRGFPQLAASVHAFCGDDAGHREILRCIEVGEDWTAQQEATDIVLTPAACYPIYPVMAARGTLPEDGRTADMFSYCFRREPSLEPTRMQLFRIREYVRIGTPAQVSAFREMWMERAPLMFQSMGLPFEIDVANDPFFGRVGKLKANGQRDQQLKFELLVPVNSTVHPTACCSFNAHLDHFSQVWNLRLTSGERAHTGCVGFGLERITLALFRHHGLDSAAWPVGVRAALWP